MIKTPSDLYVEDSFGLLVISASSPQIYHKRSNHAEGLDLQNQFSPIGLAVFGLEVNIDDLFALAYVNDVGLQIARASVRSEST